MQLPSAIIFINSDPITITADGYFVDGYSVNPNGVINDVTKTTLESQLFIDETITLKEFNERVNADPNYPAIIHLQGYRIMVIVTDYQDHTNRTYADLVLFYNSGQVSVQKNKFGPPGFSLSIQKINIYELLRDVGSKYVTILPPSNIKPPRKLGGIVVSQLADSSGVHDPNEDNISNNTDFINRK